ncbi:MAG: Outer membrane porin [uncultured Caballeronia sp.]|nr:MAG: Outer membrane porin [uncultured Caballeronia sp.]
MKKNILASAALAAFVALAATCAHAQSSVTLYGVIDAGISYVNNSSSSPTRAGDSLWKYDDGVAQGSRWGLKGSEDLGGGLKAIFTLENGFNSGTGTLGQGGAEFGRQAFVGISKNDVGSLTFGRQYTFNTDFLGSAYSIGGQTVAGNYAYHMNDFDQLTSNRINNAVKFTSANFYGFTFGAMYGFSNTAGAFAGTPNKTVGTTTTQGSSRAYSFGLNYKAGPLGIGAAYTDIHYPTATSPAFSSTIANINTTGTTNNAKDLRSFGIGANYAFGAETVFGLWTNTRFEPIVGTSSRINTFDIGGKYAITSAMTAGLGYTYMDLYDNFEGHWHQIDASFDYELSKRTDVYALAVYQKASGSNNGVENPASIGSSSSSYFGTSGLGENNQLAFRVGMRHKF